MTTQLKQGECMSHGHIMRIQNEERKIIHDKMKEFFKDGGKVESVPPEKSGLQDGAKFKFSI